MARKFRSVGVVGLGTMGAGIVEVFARAGVAVVGVEPTGDALERGRAHLQRSTDRAVGRGRLSEADRDALHALVTFTTAMDDLREVDLVIEAVPERMDLKQQVFDRADEICRPDAVLATNTSSLSVTEIAAATSRPGRVVGMHFFNPAPVLQLVEIVRTVVAEDAVVDDVAGLATHLGKSPVVVEDRAGFVANTLLFGYLNAAVRMHASRFASREDLDTALRAGCGYPMGPLTLLDLIGLDTSYQILNTMYAETRDRLHAPSPLLRQMVTAGLYGRKSGRGFYTYDKPASGTVVADDRTPPETASSGTPRVRLHGVGQSSDRLAALLDEAGLPLVGHREDYDVAVAAAPVDGLVAEGVGAVDRPRDLVGLRLVTRGGAPVLTEVVRTVASSASAVRAGRTVGEFLGLPTVVCGDRPGGIVAALQLPYLNDAVAMVGAGYATADDVDTAMTKGAGYPQGPLEALDQLGLDVALDGLRSLHASTGEPGHVPAPLLQELVAAGFVGRGKGRGLRPTTDA